MREILFRGKRADNGQWVYGFYAQELQGQHYILADEGDFYDGPMLTMVEIIPESVGQYTGLNDHAGTKIFNGDIVMIDGDTDEIGVVEWDEDELKYYIDSEGCLLSLGEFYSKELEVIGNIHDNPELLEA